MRTLHIVSHTHWDREWYRTFQQFRFRLVHMLDRLLDLLDGDPEYRFFTLDGQTIVVDDYLAIHPEQVARIHRLVQEGRLLIGPWYILPDEFLEGPEAMVRNLLFGRRGCRRFTAELQPMERIGYIPDPFGHISQLPQIAAGFGMEALCFWRGVGDAPTELRWAAPDGTERLLLHLRDSYSNGAWFAIDEEGFVRDLAAERDALTPYAPTSHLLIMQGTDHMESRADLPSRMQVAEAALGDRVVHSTLPAYLAAVQSELGEGGIAALPLRRGEMRSPERAHLLPAVLSTRMWIKQWNARCETLLTRWAEPFSAWAEQMTGIQDQRGFLRQSWDWLLQNHPHDSICGCSVDQVHTEMRTRFAWSEQIAEQVTEASLQAIAAQMGPQDASPVAGHAPRIAVFNPTAFARSDRVRARVSPAPAGEWHLLDGNGQKVPHRVMSRTLLEHMDTAMDRTALSGWLDQVAAGAGRIFGDFIVHHVQTRIEGDIAHLDVTVVSGPPAGGPAELPLEAMNAVRSLLADDHLQGFHLHVVEDAGLDLELLAHDLPSLGYKQFTVSNEPIPDAGLQPSNSQQPGLIENEFFVVEASPADGTLTITDKAAGLALSGANHFVDGGDRGDEYNFCPPENDTLVDAPATPPVIRRLDDGIGSTLEIEMIYRLPRALSSGDRSRRSGDPVEVPITSRVTLTPGVHCIEFETRVDNGADDHRLRVHFPTPIVTGRSWAESHFDVVERPIALPIGTEGWIEQPVGTHPQNTFVDVSDGQRGLLLANRGLPEYEVLPGTEDAPGATLALTLLRCVGWLSRADLTNRQGHAGPALPTPEAQCSGSHVFHYALVPHTGNYLTAQREAHAFAAPLRAVYTDGPAGPLPPAGSFLEVEPAAVVLSTVKPPEQGDGLIVRVYNSAPVPVQARLEAWRPMGQATLISMDEATVIRSLMTDGDAVTLPLRGKEIATVWFK
jgi:mannosylglycerate hydrolase